MKTFALLLLVASCGAVPTDPPQPVVDADLSDVATPILEAGTETSTCRHAGDVCGAEGLAPCCPGLTCADFCR